MKRPFYNAVQSLLHDPKHILFAILSRIPWLIPNDVLYLRLLYWLNYNSLPIILSVALFILIRQLRVPHYRFWNLLVKFAPYTFGVYLIHDHLTVRQWLWTTVSLPSYCDNLFFPLIVIGLCVVIFVICALLDIIRKKLFTLFGIDDLIIRVDRWSFYS